jgi:hypothetical protein
MVSRIEPTTPYVLPQVGFRDMKLVQKTKVEKRINAIVNRLNSTKREEYPDLAAEREAYEKEVPGAKLPSALFACAWSLL